MGTGRGIEHLRIGPQSARTRHGVRPLEGRMRLIGTGRGIEHLRIGPQSARTRHGVRPLEGRMRLIGDRSW